MNIAYRAFEFFSDAAHGDVLGDQLPDGIFLPVGEFWDPSGIAWVPGSFYNSPTDGQGIVSGILF